MATNQNENAKDQVSRAADAARDTAREGIRVASESTQSLADQAVQLFGFSGARAQELTQQSTQNLEAVAQTSTVLVQGFQEVSQGGSSGLAGAAPEEC